MQQENRRGILRPGLSVEEGEPIDRYRAVRSWVIHKMYLSMGSGSHQLRRSVFSIKARNE